MVAVVTYYSFLSSFSWLLVMAFDVWRTLRLSTVHLRVVSTESRWYIFASYCALCWIVLPGILVSTALSMEYFQVDSAFWPGFGVQNCWFGKRKALIVFFAIPVGVIMVMNIAFFISSTHMICATTLAQSNKSSSTHRDYKLFARLALLMGLTWIIGFIADYLNSEAIWYIFVALNAFQGFFIFIAFTWTKKVRNRWRIQVSRDTKSKYAEKEVTCWTWRSSRTINTETSD
ncbi:probable G-protein coupled receptor Mth-like 1 [Zootermopsis nevadensis]|nr:probable G-protein coupled receptor Mth-like 1 [Zootermopsis nevadensis]